MTTLIELTHLKDPLTPTAQFLKILRWIKAILMLFY